MSDILEELRQGTSILSHDEPTTDLLDSLPEDFDEEKFKRGQQFFRKNLFGCHRGMFLSLIMGMSVDQLLNVLVATGKSSDPVNSFKRYLYTFLQVLRWHYGNIWKKHSTARKSIIYVRLRHSKARKIMNSHEDKIIHKETMTEDNVGDDVGESLLNKDNHNDETTGMCCPVLNGRNGKKLYITQYDMALVQSGFVGLIILYPRFCGIRCTTEELDDFVYVWRWIGYVLGIEDKYNICAGGYEQAYKICKAIEMDIVLPSLKKPAKHYEFMANAFLDGIKMATKGKIRIKLKPIIALAFDLSGTSIPFPLTFHERLYMLFEYAISYAVLYIPGLGNILSRFIEKVFNCHKMT